MWDDEVFTTAEPIRSVSGLWQIWFSPSDIPSEGHYWPIVYSSFWLEHKLWGFAPLGYHVVNILLHLVNTLLLWRLMAALVHVPGAWVIAAIFAVHPLHVESVAWVIERKDLLAALFYLGAVLAYLRFLEYSRPGSYFSSLVLFVAGLLCQVDCGHAARGVGDLSLVATGARDFARRDALGVLFCGGICHCVCRLVVLQCQRAGFLSTIRWFERVLIAAPALWFYAGKLLWPVNLAVIYPHWDLADPLNWSYVPRRCCAGIVALFCAALDWARATGWRVVFCGDAVASARFYRLWLHAVLLCGGSLSIPGWYRRDGGAHRRHGTRRGRAIGRGAMGCAEHRCDRAGCAGRDDLSAGGRLPRRQVTFFSHIVSLNPQARGAHANLGNALRKQGRLEECLAISLSGIGKDPDAAKVHTNVGLVLLKQGRFGEAEPYLRRALELEPRNPYFLQNMGELLRKQDRYAEAVEYYGAALKSDARFALAHAALGDALFRLARYDEAIEPLERAIDLQADSSRTRSARKLLSRARILSRNPDPGDVVQRFRGDTETLMALGDLYREQKRYAESLVLYRAAIENDADLVQARAGLGDALFRLARYDEAASEYETGIILATGFVAGAHASLFDCRSSAEDRTDR